MPSKDSKKPPTAKGPYTPAVSLARGSTLLLNPDYPAAPAHENTAASSKAAAKAPVTPPPTTAVNGYSSIKNKPRFQPPVQANPERPPTSKGPIIPTGSRRS
ncbi:unnamed protein product [Urochloa humidicola]